jgi:mono/diheme cytochrome c family protein
MKTKAAAALAGFMALMFYVSCGREPAPPKPSALLNAYYLQQDWNDPSHLIPLGYQQAQGRRLFFDKCVWCHADSTPAGPSNRSNLSPAPALINDGTVLNALGDDYLRNIITLGGSALGKSAMMPPWGKTLTQDDIRALITYVRAVAQPPYQAPARPQPQYSVR